MATAMLEKNELRVPVKCFNLPLTLDCGQAFRWRQEEDGSFKGAAFGKFLHISQETDGTLVFYNTSDEEFNEIWKHYFDLERDYETLCEDFCRGDESLKTAVEAYPGIRILNQEPWEALCSFIISQNNNIPRIKGIVERFCHLLGDPLEDGFYSFPTAEKMANLTVEDLAPLRAGFRAKYLLDAARKVCDGTVNLEALPQMDIDEARAELQQICGVGPKVAECVLLYSCGKTEAFPKDVWVKRILEELYPDGLPECINGVQGIAQQFLFHWRRNKDR